MKSNIYVFAVKASFVFVGTINRIFGRGVSRLNFIVARLLEKSHQNFEARTWDGLRWELQTNSFLDCMIGMNAMEPHVLRHIAKCDLAGGTVVDMGANVGGVTLRLATAVGEKGTVIAYEPNPIVAQKLRLNVELNGLGHTVLVLEKGVWSSPGNFTMYLPAHTNFGTASLVDQAANLGGETIVVETETFDSRWASLGKPTILFVKMDIQGAEQQAIIGMSAMLTHCKPDLLIEIFDDVGPAQHRLSDMFCSVQPFQYSKVYKVEFDGLKELSAADVLARKKDDLQGDFLFSTKNNQG